MLKYVLPQLLFLPFFVTGQNFYLFVGTYTSNGSKGIYVYNFNADSGTAKWISNTNGVVNPSYLAVAPNGKYVYAVNETNGAYPGKISAFSFDKNSGQLTFINQQPTGGDDPCYVSVSKNNKWVMAGNYSGGSVSAFTANDNGSLNACSQLLQHSGKSKNEQRQEKAHVHSTVFSPDENFLFTPDLGTDKVMIYKFNANSEKPLTPSTPPYIPVAPGNGPRHFIFHPNKKFAYLAEEMSGTVGVYRYLNGKLTPIQNIASHPSDFKGDISSADIHTSLDGKFLYVSNRGDENNIAIFSINAATGKLKLKGYQPTLGKTPRNFIIDPTGNYLLVANQNTNNIVIFKRDKQTGLLSETGKGLDVPNPVCLQMMQ